MDLPEYHPGSPFLAMMSDLHELFGTPNGILMLGFDVNLSCLMLRGNAFKPIVCDTGLPPMTGTPAAAAPVACIRPGRQPPLPPCARAWPGARQRMPLPRPGVRTWWVDSLGRLAGACLQLPAALPSLVQPTLCRCPPAAGVRLPLAPHTLAERRWRVAGPAWRHLSAWPARASVSQPADGRAAAGLLKGDPVLTQLSARASALVAVAIVLLLGGKLASDSAILGCSTRSSGVLTGRLQKPRPWTPKDMGWHHKLDPELGLLSRLAGKCSALPHSVQLKATAPQVCLARFHVLRML